MCFIRGPYDQIRMICTFMEYFCICMYSSGKKSFVQNLVLNFNTLFDCCSCGL